MAKTFDELMELYGHTKISDADLALGKDNPGALETILKSRGNWADLNAQYQAATDPAEKQRLKAAMDAENNTANTQRRAYGNYSGGADGMGGQYSPTYVKPSPAAQNDNVTALYEKYNNLYGKNNAPTWTPQYQEQISQILGDITNRDPFEYKMTEDPLYQQYRDQYIREGQRAMKDTMAQTAMMSGGYANTAGAIAAQQGYDNYLAQLNDRVPQLEQMAYGKYADNLQDMYNQLGAYQSEENRLYGQYMDALGQFNTDRDYAFRSMQAAMDQNNYENEFNRNIFESDRDYNFGYRQQDIENAASFGDWDKVEGYDYDVDFMRQQQALDELQMAYQTGQLGAKMNGATGGNSRAVYRDDDDDNSGAGDYEITNQQNDEEVYIPGLRWVGNLTLKKLLETGEVVEEVDGNKITYKKAR